MIPLHDDNPTATTPFVTLGLIVSCVIVFIWQIGLGPGQEAAILTFGVTPANLLGSNPSQVGLWPPATILTSMFLHGGWMHLIGNMLYLWIFGNNIEDSFGHVRFVFFYIVCGALAAFAQSALLPVSRIPMIGASGAISGVLGAYLVLFPRARVLVLIPLGFLTRLVRLPAALVLGFWFVIQLLSAMAADAGRPGVAFAAHAGGFAAGMALIPLFRRRKPRT